MYKFKVSDIIRQPNHNISIRFEDLSGNYPKYLAGQFLTLSLFFGDREVRRSYSFSSSPDCNEAYEITVKRVENGEVSRFLHDKLQVGDTIDVMESQGVFYYEPNPKKARVVFLFAAGVGITPLYSILKTALKTELISNIVLVYSNSTKEHTLFYDELITLLEDYPDRLKIEFIWSNSKNLMKARLNRDYLIDLVNVNLKEGYEPVFYTCGPLFYMDLCRFTLLGMGFPQNAVKRETFYFPDEEEDDDEREEEVVNTSSYDVILNFNGNTIQLTVPYNKTILDVGLENNLKLPYSCRSGMCSTCISQVLEGEVKMDYNEVLTDREMDQGRCLLCTSHPLVNNTVIDVL